MIFARSREGKAALAGRARIARSGLSSQWLALLLLAPLAGCYSYSAVEPGNVRAGELVRARITAVEADRLESRGQLPDDSRIVEGRVVGNNGEGLMVDVPATTRRTGAGLEVLHRRIALSPSGVLELERKQMDRFRTGAVIVVGTAALGYLVATQLTGEPGKDDQPGPGPLERRRSSLLILRIPL